MIHYCVSIIICTVIMTVCFFGGIQVLYNSGKSNDDEKVLAAVALFFGFFASIGLNIGIVYNFCQHVVFN